MDTTEHPTTLETAATIVGDNIEFDVPGVGKFGAKRLTTMRYLQMLKKKRELVVYVLGDRQDPANLPEDVELSCQVLATLMIIDPQLIAKAETHIIVDERDKDGNPTKAHEEPCPLKWHGPETTGDDVCWQVFNCYMDARSQVEDADVRNKDLIKN